MSAAAIWKLVREGGTARDEIERSAPLGAVLRRVYLLLERRSSWLGSSVRQAFATTLLSAYDERVAERRWFDETPAIKELERELQENDVERERDLDSPLQRVVKAFALTADEVDALHVCLAVALDPRLASSFARLREDPEQTHVSEALVAELTGKHLPLLSKNGGLLGWGLVRAADAERGALASLTVDPYVLGFACGEAGSDPGLSAFETTVEPLEAIPSWPVAEAAERVGKALAVGAPLRMAIRGPRGSGRATFADLVARSQGRPVLALDTTAIRDEAWSEMYLRAQRQARVTGACIVWRGAYVTRPFPPCPGIAALQFVTGDVDLALSPQRGVADDSISLPGLGLDERVSLFRRFIPESNAWGDEVLGEVAARYRVQVGDIVAIGRRGIGPVEGVREACRAATRHRLGELGQQLDCPFTRQDLTLSSKLDVLLDDLLFEARERVRFWEAPGRRRLFPRGRGLIALMAGPPGTGKTMAAQVIAAELGLDLFRVDLASAVNKYIGETAKNLRKVFARAAEMSAVLLFDEADALFSKRTEVRDAHDRYANADTNYLLQLLEEFDGVALLASNKMANIDTAFTRRIRYVLDFRAPEAAERLVLWRRIVAELAGAEVEQALERQLGAAAELIEVSGAQIKLAVLGGLLVAKRLGEPLRGAHLCVALQRELAKTGRSLGVRERTGIEAHDR